ncbi:MAG: four helix bundle protein [Meiothermus sp.]
MAEPYTSYFGFENLEVYQLGLEFIAEIYQLTKRFPKSEQFGLTNQIQRAAVSVCLNIAEGRGRDGDKDFVRFLGIARGSLFEVVSGLYAAIKLEYLSEAQIQSPLANASRIKAKLNPLANAVSKD